MMKGNDAVYAPKPMTLQPHPYPPSIDGASEFSRTSSEYPPSYKQDNCFDAGHRKISRTPSPTPSETEALSGKLRTCNLKPYFDPAFYKNPKNVVTVIITLVIIGGVIALAIEEDKIIAALKPFTDWMRSTPGGFLIPIGVMIVLSFPPLFGQDLIAVLCGEVYGPWMGFAIVATGTILGELVTFYTFRTCCISRAKEQEDKSLSTALLSEVIRTGGFKVVLMARYSAIPPHITTAIFSVCGMTVGTFLLAAFLSLPNQFATVYLGIDQSGSDDATKKRTKIIKIVVISLKVVITIIAMRYITKKQEAVKTRVIHARRMRRQAKISGSSSFSNMDVDIEDTPMTPLVPRTTGGGVMPGATYMPSSSASYSYPSTSRSSTPGRGGRYDNS